MRLQLQSSYRGRMVQMRLHRWLQERYIDPTQLRPSKRASCCHPTLSSRGVFALCRMRWLNEMLRSPSRTRCHCRTQFQAYPLRLSLTPWRKKAENSRCCCRAGLGVSSDSRQRGATAAALTAMSRCKLPTQDKENKGTQLSLQRKLQKNIETLSPHFHNFHFHRVDPWIP